MTRRLIALLLTCAAAGAGDAIHPLDRNPPPQPLPFWTGAPPAGWTREAARAAPRPVPPAPDPVVLDIIEVAGDGAGKRLGLQVGMRVLALGGQAVRTTLDWARARTAGAPQAMTVVTAEGERREVQVPAGQLGFRLHNRLQLEALFTQRDARWDAAVLLAAEVWSREPEVALAACQRAADAGFPRPALLHLVAAWTCWQAQRWNACLDHAFLAFPACPEPLMPLLLESTLTAALCSGHPRLAERLLERHGRHLPSYASLAPVLSGMCARYRDRPPPLPQATQDWQRDDLLHRTQARWKWQGRWIDQILEEGTACVQIPPQGSGDDAIYPGVRALAADLTIWPATAQGATSLTIGDGAEDPESTRFGLRVVVDHRGFCSLVFTDPASSETPALTLPQRLPLSWKGSSALHVLVHEGWCRIAAEGEPLYDGPLVQPCPLVTLTVSAGPGHTHLRLAADELLPPAAWQERLRTARDERGRAGMTRLHRAAQLGQADRVAALIAAGAALETRDAQGRTALHRAAERNQVEVMRLLVDAGAALDPADAHDRLPLDRAWALKADAAAAFLRARGARNAQPQPPTPAPRPRPAPPAAPPPAPTPRPTPAAKPPTPRPTMTENPLDDF